MKLTLLILSLCVNPTALAMCPATASLQRLQAHKKPPAIFTAQRAMSSRKLHNHYRKIPNPDYAWKYTYMEYQKALIDREKCKTWKQIGYGMHEGYCTKEKGCDCTYRLVLIAKK